MTPALPPSAGGRTAGATLARLAALPAGKRAKWAILAAWLVAVALLGPFAGKLASVEENDAAAWLPSNAESLAVERLQQRFPAGETSPAVVVYRRAAGLTPADRDAVAADRDALARRFPDTPPSEPVPATDGRALLFAVPLSAADEDAIIPAVDAIRAEVGAGGDGLAVKVTGPAGFTADFVEVFDGIDSTLLLASVLVVAVLLLLT